MMKSDFAMPAPVAEPPPSSVINIMVNNSPSNMRGGYAPRGFGFRPPFRQQHNNTLLNSLPDDFDGKRLRKSNMRKTVDYNCSIARMLQNRVWQRDYRDRHALQPDCLYIPDLLPPVAYRDNPINSVTTRFVKTATNKMRCPIFTMAWTPEGRRLVTGASSGEFTLWNGLTFNFETILQAHDSPVRSMVWSHNDCWMVTGDHAGYVKYWQSNMNNVRMFQAHKEPLRGLSFSPTDQKLVSCSDDGTLRIWDFHTCQEERVLRGHGADVKCCGWHPSMGLIVSGSKDNQQPIKLWDPKSGNSLTTLHAHKATVMDLKWNRNGNWFITASRDHFLKLFDIRNLAQPVQTFRGHKKEASCIAWHPHHEGLLASGGSDGTILFWHVGADKEVGSIDSAHDSIVWTLDWHPLGHILASGSNDHTSKFWTRNRPGDKMRDKYNLNLNSNSQNDDDCNEESMIPGMAPEDRIESSSDAALFAFSSAQSSIPGLEETEREAARQAQAVKPKPVPKNFAESWNVFAPVDIPEPIIPITIDDDDEEEEGYGTESVLDPITDVVNKILESQPGTKRIEELEPQGIIAFGRVIPIRRCSKMFRKIRRGYDPILSHLTSGRVKELKGLPGMSELEYLYEEGSDSSEDDEGFGPLPTREELAVDKLKLDEYLKPFKGFKEPDFNDAPYIDKESREPPPRGFGREEMRDERDEGVRGRRDRDRDDRDEKRGPRGNRGSGPFGPPIPSRFPGGPFGPNGPPMGDGPNFDRPSFGDDREGNGPNFGPRDFDRNNFGPRDGREFDQGRDFPPRDVDIRRDFGNGGPRRDFDNFVNGPDMGRNFGGPRDNRDLGNNGPRDFDSREFGNNGPRDFDNRDFGNSGPPRNFGDGPRRDFGGPRDFPDNDRVFDGPRNPGSGPQEMDLDDRAFGNRDIREFGNSGSRDIRDFRNKGPRDFANTGSRDIREFGNTGSRDIRDFGNTGSRDIREFGNSGPPFGGDRDLDSERGRWESRKRPFDDGGDADWRGDEFRGRGGRGVRRARGSRGPRRAGRGSRFIE